MRWRTAITLALALAFVAGGAVTGYRLLTDPAPEGDDDGGSESSYVQPTEWDRYSRKGDLTIQYVGSACQSGSEVVVEEAKSRVVVTLRTEVAPGECAEGTERYRVPIKLRKPLQQREVYDGACLMGDQPQRACVRERAGANVS